MNSDTNEANEEAGEAFVELQGQNLPEPIYDELFVANIPVELEGGGLEETLLEALLDTELKPTDVQEVDIGHTGNMMTVVTVNGKLSLVSKASVSL